MLINDYLKILKKQYGKKRFNRLKYLYVYLSEDAIVNGLCFVYRKNVEGLKGQKVEDYPVERLDVHDDVKGKKCYAQVSISPLTVRTYLLD